MVPTAWGSRGEPLLPDLPDPTPEPRENGSCHTSLAHTLGGCPEEVTASAEN